MTINTHKDIDKRLCGNPISTENGTSRVELNTDKSMAVDHYDLVHGGFIFGLADHAAMIAVNHPNVVLGSASAKFLKPVKVGQTLIAEASVDSSEGKKQEVLVNVVNNDEKVFEGKFICFVLDQHVLA